MKEMKKLVSFAAILTLTISLAACGGPREVTDMAYSIEYREEALSGTYTGTTVENIPEGEGTFTCTDEGVTFVYTGTWEAGAMVGEGQLEYSAYAMTVDEDTEYVGQYNGTVVDGLPSGEGTYESVDEDEVAFVYEGEWADGLFNGQGERLFDSDDYEKQIGNFEEGQYRPTPAEYFVCMGTIKDQDYEVTDNALKFMETYPDIFLNNSIEGTEVEVDTSFSYDAFAKNPSVYGDKLITVKNLYVVQIFEKELYGEEVSFMILSNSAYGDDVYFVNMYGYAEGIYEGSYVTLTALPLDFFTYPNTADQRIWAIACAGVSVS